MKRIIVSVLVLSMLTVSLVACGGKSNDSEKPVEVEQEVTEELTDTTTESIEDTEVSTENEEVDTENEEQSDTTADKNATSGASTIGSSLEADFESSLSSCNSTEEIANILVKNANLGEWSMIVEQVEEGYLNGFDADITGFNEGSMFAPMISTIPFVGYVFKTDDIDTLTDTLNSHANLNWNICTEADELVVSSKGDYVFCVMTPNSNN